MPYVEATGAKLYFEESGSGYPIIFIHELASDLRGWSAQTCYFVRGYRCIAYNARGYPPSEIPDNEQAYSQDQAREDLRAVLDGMEIELAHVVGISMGAFAALHFGMAYPSRARSLVLGGCGYGAEP